MAISAKQVKALRDKTGAGMMDCKKALVKSDGDMDQALEYLQVKGLAATAKRGDREANEGVVAFVSKGGTGAMVEVNCETDFVARNGDFQAFAAKLVEHAAGEAPADRDAWLASSLGAGSVEDFVRENAVVLGENVVVGRVNYFATDGPSVVNGYIHHDKKTGVMIQLGVSDEAAASNDAVIDVARKLSMHIAAAKPEAVSSDDVDADEVAKQRALFAAQGLDSGKPANIVEKIAEGRLRKWLKEICLLEQPFVMDTDLTVAKLLKKVGAEVGAEVTVRQFARTVIG